MFTDDHESLRAHSSPLHCVALKQMLQSMVEEMHLVELGQEQACLKVGLGKEGILDLIVQCNEVAIKYLEIVKLKVKFRNSYWSYDLEL